MSFILGAVAGVILSRLAIWALRRRAANLSPAAQPSATDTSERGDLGSIPKQNFWR